MNLQERKDRVAELMSQGLDTVQIRTRLGMSNGTIQRVISEIRKDLGWQAQ
jgi:DNA-binding NarL/FixJ family response regulator